ncbi:MAG TPA: sensor domain-containing diguanylate cyclase [Candidatus Polarisedimenticolia bacterium]|nr:sensor domain-containing diguanylate cyclase [Candidatus Polarisedimenticolia bacterium]
MGLEFSPSALLAPPVLIASAVTLLVGLIAGALLRGKRSAPPEKRRGYGAPEDAEDTEVRDLRRTIHLLQNENRNLSTFLMTLPDLARQLNAGVEKRKIPALLMGFIEQLFDAEQVLIFQTTHDGKHLTIATTKGLPEGASMQEVVPFGKGRIGWVALHQLVMDENDFSQKSRSGRSEMSADLHPLFRTEICAPMVAKGETLGVISLGGLLRRPKNDKNMLKMVADLGSIAIQNTVMFNKIQESANSDGLTSLHNKRFFMTKLADELLKSEKEQKCLSLFLFDIDHFKTYNDTNGHLAGDEALKSTGRLLKDSVRDDDIPARYGGEEFVVLLPGTDKKGAMVAAEKIRRVVEEHPFANGSSQPGGRVTISGGVATFPYDASTMADLIRCADQALYEGKRSGRNKVCSFEPKYFSDEQTGTNWAIASDQRG